MCMTITFGVRNLKIKWSIGKINLHTCQTQSEALNGNVDVFRNVDKSICSNLFADKENYLDWGIVKLKVLCSKDHLNHQNFSIEIHFIEEIVNNHNLTLDLSSSNLFSLRHTEMPIFYKVTDKLIIRFQS